MAKGDAAPIGERMKAGFDHACLVR